MHKKTILSAAAVLLLLLSCAGVKIGVTKKTASDSISVNVNVDKFLQKSVSPSKIKNLK